MSSNKRILCITESLGSGGAERQLTGLAVMLKERGYTVKFITYYRNQFYEPFLYENGIDYELHEELRNKYQRVFRLVKILRKYKPETVISFLPSVNITVCLARLFYKMNLIVSERSSTQMLTLKTRLQFNLYRLADSVVANSNNEAAFIKRTFKYLKNKTYVIFNYVDLDYFTPKPVLELAREEKVILSVGRIIPLKNILRYLDAIKIVVDKGYNCKFIWVGDVKNFKYVDAVEVKLKSLSLEHVFYLEEPTDDIINYYHTADFFCLPSLYEGYPNVIVEAMSCGLPILCSNVCENPYIVKSETNGFLFSPESEIEMSEVIIKILSLSDENIDRISRNNLNQISERNTKSIFFSSYENLL